VAMVGVTHGPTRPVAWVALAMAAAALVMSVLDLLGVAELTALTIPLGGVAVVVIMIIVMRRSVSRARGEGE
jgi:hypothetical protein